ncbi:MAG: hypothetical protein KY453_04910, partial [Gemmatimonadetes bacterium]|nr:hypothetical protein [Gemmatimonadota bacterium]
MLVLEELQQLVGDGRGPLGEQPQGPVGEAVVPRRPAGTVGDVAGGDQVVVDEQPGGRRRGRHGSREGADHVLEPAEREHLIDLAQVGPGLGPSHHRDDRGGGQRLQRPPYHPRHGSGADHRHPLAGTDDLGRHCGHRGVGREIQLIP